MKTRVLSIAAFVAGVMLVQAAQANVLYEYVGNTFHDPSGIYGSAFTTGDSISGTVEFSHLPAPGGSFGKTDVVAFSFSAGPLEITDTSPLLDEYELQFGFDESGNIQNWLVMLSTKKSDGPTDDRMFILTFSGDPQEDEPLSGFTAIDLVRFGPIDAPEDNAALSSARLTEEPGTWSVVPEPSAMALWMLAGVCGAALRMRCRRIAR